jgi:predicted O-methyltransferase YrrM
MGDNVVRDGEVTNPESDDARVQGVRRFIEMMGDNRGSRPPRCRRWALKDGMALRWRW